jgi:subtilase family serine protease
MANGGSTQFRNYPDVAMLAINVEFFSQRSTNSNNAGTSFAALLWAGFMALVDQRSNQNGAGLIGFLNPTIYAIAEWPFRVLCHEHRRLIRGAQLYER